MTKPKATRAARRKPAPLHPVNHQPGKGLTISTEARFPATIDDKVVCAKSVVQAVIAAHDSGALDDHNYDLHWPLSLAVDLLEQASTQFSKLRDRQS